MNKKFLIFFIAILFLGFAAATFSCNDFSSKWSYCSAMNISGIACDSFWINASDCSIGNYSINMSNYMTKEQFANYTANSSFSISSFIGNLSNSSSFNLTIVYVGNGTNNSIGEVNETKILFDMMGSGAFVSSNDSRIGNNVNQAPPQIMIDFSAVWVLIVIMLVGECLLVFTVLKKKEKPKKLLGSEDEILAAATVIAAKRGNKNKNAKQ